MNKKVDHIILIIKYLLLSLPILLITGPLLPEIAIGIIFFLMLYDFFKKKFFFPEKKFLICFLLFYLILVTGSIFSDYTLYSLKSSIFYIRFLILTFAVYYVLDNSKNFLNLLKNILFIIFILLILDGFYQYLFKQNIIGLTNFNKGRVSSFFGKELIYGSYLARFLPILIGLLIFFQKKNSDKLIIYLLILLSAVSIFISGERAAIILSLTSIIIIVFTTNFFKKSKFYIFFFIISFFTIITFSNDVIKKKWQSTITGTVFNLLNEKIIIDNKTYPLIINEKYTYMTLSSYKMFKEKPLIGHGVKSFRFNCKKEPYKFDKFDSYNFRLNCGNHPHNTYMQLLSETGLISFALVLCYFFIIFYNLILSYINSKKGKYAKTFDFKVCILSCIFINLFPLTTTGNFFNNWLSIVYFFPIGFLLFLNKNYKFSI
mgnify:FL=1